ncbi:MAG TPA: hypothetical protein PL009_03935 [Flavipsychrobacter sp.]|nr:hypothetical protein [Flavipsychrobacter sp.]
MSEQIGFDYTVTDEQLEAFQKWTIEERLNWILENMKFMRAIQTREERIRMYRAKGGKNLKYYEEHGFPEWI